MRILKSEKGLLALFLSTLLNNLIAFDDTHAIIESGRSHETVIFVLQYSGQRYSSLSSGALCL